MNLKRHLTKEKGRDHQSPAEGTNFKIHDPRHATVLHIAHSWD